jgi:tripartite ATP-independent transporter DctM subunit
VLCVSALVYIWIAGLPLVLVAQQMFVGLNSFVILGVPLFILGGNIMGAASITDRIVRLSNLLVGRVRGGLAYVAIVANVIFAGVVGAGAAAAAATGVTLIPAMIRAGYPPAYAAALIACGAVIGPVIPPSIALVLYGSLANVSITALFIGGIIPGIVCAVALAVLVAYQGKKLNLPVSEHSPQPGELRKAFLEALPGIMMPVIILGGMLLGLFTVTEAAAVSAFYALLIGMFFYRTLTLRQLWDVIVETGIMVGNVMLVVSTAALFTWILAAESVPQRAVEWAALFQDNIIVLMLVLTLLLLFIGTFMETLTSIIILTPVLLPLLKHAGIDLLYFGEVMNLNVSIGLITPPTAVNLFVASVIAKESMDKVFRASLPMFFVLCVAMGMIIAIPELSTWLPGLFYRE